MEKRSVPVTLDGSTYSSRVSVMRSLDAYAPQANPEEWAEVEGFARDAAMLTAERTGREALLLLKTVGPYLVWCVFEHGLDLQPGSVFATRFIQLYCHQWSGSSAATHRSTLMAFARTLVPEKNPAPLAPLPRKVIQPPYTDGELLTLRTWARGQHTEIKRRRAKLLLALGAGAGLWNRELIALRGSDVTVDGAGVLLAIQGAAPREVPVLRAWETWVADAAESSTDDEYLWAPRSGRVHGNTLWDFTSAASGLAPTVSRLRATWLATHVQAGTPMKELFKAGGIDRFDNLHHYLPYIPSTDRSDYRRLLREGRVR